MLFSTDEGEIYFDLLLLSMAKKTQTAIFDVNSMVNELIDSKYDERRKMIHKCSSMITGLGFEIFHIEGLINDSRIQEFLRTAPTTEAGKPDLFKPQLTQKRFKAIKNKLSEKEKERQALIQGISTARKNLEAFIIKVEEENQERFDANIEESNNKLKQLEKENNKAVKKVEKSLVKGCKEVNKSYDSKENEIKEELENIQNSQKEIEGGNWGARKRRLENDLKTRQLFWQLMNLEKERVKELESLKENSEQSIEGLKAQFLEAESNVKQYADKLYEDDKADLKKIMDISSLLKTLRIKL